MTNQKDGFQNENLKLSKNLLQSSQNEEVDLNELSLPVLPAKNSLVNERDEIQFEQLQGILEESLKFSPIQTTLSLDSELKEPEHLVIDNKRHYGTRRIKNSTLKLTIPFTENLSAAKLIGGIESYDFDLMEKITFTKSHEPLFKDCYEKKSSLFIQDARAVSYTHLTLPTICSV